MVSLTRKPSRPPLPVRTVKPMRRARVGMGSCESTTSAFLSIPRLRQTQLIVISLNNQDGTRSWDGACHERLRFHLGYGISKRTVL